MLTGHTKKIENAIKETTDIVIASFTKLGFPGSDASGEDSYDQAEIEITGILKGTLAEKHLKVFYIVQSMPGKNQEKAPIIGVQYIMFIQKLSPNEYEIKKLLPATDENIIKIKALIAS